MIQETAERIDETRQDVHEWSDGAISRAIVLTLFYGGLAITVLGLVVVLVSYVVARR